MQLNSATCLLKRSLLYRSPYQPKATHLLANQHRTFAASSFIFNLKKEDETLYQVLSVKTNIDQKGIKLAYYKQAKKYHPDFQHDISEAERVKAEAQFKIIAKAYEVLSNPIARQAYDIEN